MITVAVLMIGALALQLPLPTGAVAVAGPPPLARYFVLAAVADIETAQLNVFLQSWRRYSPQTQVVLWAEQNTTLGLEVAPPHLVTRFARAGHIRLQRYELYLPFLEELQRQGVAGGVVLSDAADVVLQSDPWRDSGAQMSIAEKALLFALEGTPEEAEGKRIRDCAEATHLLEQCFNAGVAQQLGDRPLACPGVMVGSLGAVTAYVRQLLEVAGSVATEECRMQSGDQAVLNFLLHNLGPRAKLRFKQSTLHHWHSLIHHARYGWPFRIDRFGVLRRHNGSTPAIVHQYDRWTGSQGIFQAQYPHLGAGFFYIGPNASNNTPMA
ncbi:hypothetical protein ACK3TF_000923 [Chlorella vulgaris]